MSQLYNIDTLLQAVFTFPFSSPSADHLKLFRPLDLHNHQRAYVPRRRRISFQLHIQYDLSVLRNEKITTNRFFYCKRNCKQYRNYWQERIGRAM